MTRRKAAVAGAIVCALWAPALAQDRSGCIETKDYVKAMKACSELIRSNPKDAIAYRMRGDVMAKNGDLGQAIADYNKAIEINPRSAAAYNARAQAFVAKGDYERAVADVTKAGEVGSQKAQAIKPKAKTAKAPVRARPKMAGSASAKEGDKKGATSSTRLQTPQAHSEFHSAELGPQASGKELVSERPHDLG